MRVGVEDVPISSAITAIGLWYHHNILQASTLRSIKLVSRTSSGARGNEGGGEGGGGEDVPISSAITAIGLWYHHNILQASTLRSIKLVSRTSSGARGNGVGGVGGGGEDLPISSAITAIGLWYHHNILQASTLRSIKLVSRTSSGARGNEAANS